MTDIFIICNLCFMSLLLASLFIYMWKDSIRILTLNSIRMIVQYECVNTELYDNIQFQIQISSIGSYHRVLQCLRRDTQCNESGAGLCSGPRVHGHCPANQPNPTIFIYSLIVEQRLYIKGTADPYHDILQCLRSNMYCYGAEFGLCREPCVPGQSLYTRCYIYILIIFISNYYLLMLNIYCKRYEIECAEYSAVAGFTCSVYSKILFDYIIGIWPFFIHIRTQ